MSHPIKEHAGFTNWRIPNSKELATLVERSCIAPSINLSIFVSTPSAVYWSSSYDFQINISKGIYGRLIDFTDGVEFIDNTDDQRYVRLVRTIVE